MGDTADGFWVCQRKGRELIRGGDNEDWNVLYSQIGRNESRLNTEGVSSFTFAGTVMAEF